MSRTDHTLILNLLNLPRMGRQRVRTLLSHLPENTNPFDLDMEELCQTPGIDIKTARAVLACKDFDFGLNEAGACMDKGYRLVSFWDPDYPVLLKKIYDPPIILYTRGRPLLAEEDAIAVVGTRTMTPCGRNTTQTIAGELSQYGLTVVSGLARGIDTAAHRATVGNGGRTIAVFGSGLDVVYPAENRKLADQICEKGTIITEFPLATSPDRGNFPQRNRIISGLCHGTLVVEAGDKSGAILTAFNAVEQSRDVFAVPGRITDKKSRGCNRLIENGAVPLKGAEDIIRDINPRMFNLVTGVQKKINFDLSREEKMIFEHLDHDPIHVDDLAKAVSMDISSILRLLLKMELKNAVQQLGGKQLVKA